MTALAPVWWRIVAREPKSRTRELVTFTVEAWGPLAAMRRVHDLGYRLRLEEEHIAQVTLAESFDTDYRLPLKCEGCRLPTFGPHYS